MSMACLTPPASNTSGRPHDGNTNPAPATPTKDAGGREDNGHLALSVAHVVQDSTADSKRGGELVQGRSLPTPFPHVRTRHLKSFGKFVHPYGRGEGLVDSPRHPGLGGIPLVCQSIASSRLTARSRLHGGVHRGVHRGYIGTSMRIVALRVGGGRHGA